MGASCCGYQLPKQYENFFGATESGSEVINAMIAEIWPDIFTTMLEELKSAPYDLGDDSGNYRLTIKDFNREEVVDDVPVIKKIKIDADSKGKAGDAGGPVKFTAKVIYKLDKPNMNILLSARKEENGLFSFLMPDVNIHLKDLLIDATLHAEVSMKKQLLTFYFIGAPLVVWDVDGGVTKLDVPLAFENL